MQSGRWLCIGPQVARLRPSSRADILLETRPLIFSGFFSGPSAGCGTGPRKKPGRRQAAPPFRGPAVACLPKKVRGGRTDKTRRFCGCSRTGQNRTEQGAGGLFCCALEVRAREGGPGVRCRHLLECRAAEGVSVSPALLAGERGLPLGTLV